MKRTAISSLAGLALLFAVSGFSADLVSEVAPAHEEEAVAAAPEAEAAESAMTLEQLEQILENPRRMRSDARQEWAQSGDESVQPWGVCKFSCAPCQSNSDCFLQGDCVSDCI